MNKRVQDMEIALTGGPKSDGKVIAAWGTAGRFKGAAGYFMRRHDGTVTPFSLLRRKPTPIYAFGFTRGGDPEPISAANIRNPLKPIFGPRDPQEEAAA